MKKIDIQIDFNVDDEDIVKVQKELKEFEGEEIDVSTTMDDSEVKNVGKEIDDLKGEKVDTKVTVDDSDIKKAQKELQDLNKGFVSDMGSVDNAVTGIISGMAGKSIWDSVYGTSKKAETNKVLIKNMGDAKVSSEDLYDTIDKKTDTSLISMQQLIPALNGVKSATGASATEIKNVTSGVADFGQFVYALTGSSAQAESAMFDLSKGIKGAFASLDQYGITEESLKRTGLWSGEEDDLEGYIAAVNEVTGSTDALMNTTQGMEALMGKSFSRGGKRLGQYVLPAMQTILGGFLQIDDATGGWASTALLATGGVVTGFMTTMSAMGQVGNGVRSVIEGFRGVKTAVDLMRNAESLSAGVKAVLSTALGVETGAEVANSTAKSSAIIPTVTLAGAEMSLLWPLLLVVGAILLVVGALWYLYNNNETVRQGIDGLIATVNEWLGGAMNLASVIYSNLLPILQDLYGRFKLIYDALTELINGNLSLEQAILMIWGIINDTIDTYTQMILGIFINWGNSILQSVINSFNSTKLQIIAQLNLWKVMASNKVKSIINKIVSGFRQLPTKISNALNGVVSAITKPFSDAWNSVQPYIDKINSGINSLDSLNPFSSVSYEGYSSVGYEGFGNDYLNTTISKSTKNTTSSNINNNFYVNGIIEEEASEYIVNSVNNYIKKNNLIRGV